MDWYEITIIILLAVACIALVIARILQEVRTSKNWPEILAAIPGIIQEAVEMFSDYSSQLEYVIASVKLLANGFKIKIDDEKINEAVVNIMGASTAISAMSLAQETVTADKNSK